MIEKIIEVKKIELWFKPQCENCGSITTGVDSVSITDLIEIGVPICQECGDDLELMDTCKIKI